MHDYFSEAKVECGIVLVGSEVKSLRNGKAQLHESFARIERGKLILHNAHIDPYDKAAIVYNHEPRVTGSCSCTSARCTVLATRRKSVARPDPAVDLFKEAARRWSWAWRGASSSTISGNRSRRRNRTASCAALRSAG